MEQIANEVKALVAENEKLRQVVEDFTRDFEKSEKKPMACKYCIYYMRHYVKVRGGFMEVAYGHCTRGRTVKKSKNSDDSCKYFELGHYELKGERYGR